MTTGEAAALLGVASVNTIKRWARQGLLEGYQRGGRVLVSRRSVERMLGAPALAAERAHEQELDEALAPFDTDERPLPPLRWSGRKPWTRGVGPGS
jgi:excisionase family DNA binding protein